MEHNVRSLKAILILSNAFEYLKWQSFQESWDLTKFSDIKEDVVELKTALISKDSKRSQKTYHACQAKIEVVRQEYDAFSEVCAANSELCRYWDGLVKLASLLKSLIAADREGDWEAHLQAIQNLLPIFYQSGSINYLRYASWYIETMRKLPVEHPQVYKEFMEGQSAVKSNPGYFKAVAPDMKLEQTIQRSQKAFGGIIGQTKQVAYVTEWELVYHEVLAISNCYEDLTKSASFSSDAVILNRELCTSIIKEYNESVEKVTSFIRSRGNPYSAPASPKLYHFTSGQIVPPDCAKQWLNYFEDGLHGYMAFRDDRYVTKKKTLSDKIKRINLPPFIPKPKKQAPASSKEIAKKVSKELGMAQKNIDIARSRGISMRDILQYELVTDSLLFDGNITAKPQKHLIVAELEKLLANGDCHFDTANDQLTTAIIVDFMSMIRKVSFTKLNCVGESFNCMWKMIRSLCDAGEIHVVFDSYIQRSLKECERERRATEEALEAVNLSPESSIPVEMERFWASSKNKENLQKLSRDFFIAKTEEDREITVVLSGYITDGDPIESSITIRERIITERNNLGSTLEEADYRIVPHIAKASENGYKRILVASNDSDVLMYVLAYFNLLNVPELWVRFGTGKNTRNIPVHHIFKNLGPSKSRMFLKAHILTGCDITSKVGTKSAALRAQPEKFLEDFGESSLSNATLVDAEKYLVKVLKMKSKCETFDELRYMQYISKNTTLGELPPTSRSIRGHLLRSHYSVNLCLNLLEPEKHVLNPLSYGWHERNGILFPDKFRKTLPESYTMTCGCGKGCLRSCGCRRKQELCTDYCSCQKSTACKNKQ